MYFNRASVLYYVTTVYLHQYIYIYIKSFESAFLPFMQNNFSHHNNFHDVIKYFLLLINTDKV